MIDDLSSISEEERCLFRPFTRESLVVIEARIAEELRKFKELEKKRAEGDVVSTKISFTDQRSISIFVLFIYFLICHNINELKCKVGQNQKMMFIMTEKDCVYVLVRLRNIYI